MNTNFIRVLGDNDINLPRVVKSFGNAVYLAGDNSTVSAPNDTRPTFSKFDNTGALLWSIELNFFGRIADFEQTDDGAFLLVGRTPIVGSASDNQSVICKVTDFGSVLWTNLYSNTGREQFTSIIKHPNPPNPAFPYYVSGFQNPDSNTPSQVDLALLLNIDHFGVINWKQEYPGESDNQYARKIILKSNGNMVLVGDTNSGGHLLEVDGNGTPVQALRSLNPFRNIQTGVALGNGDLILAGRNNSGNGVLVKLNSNYSTIWGYQFNNQQQMLHVDIDGNDIYTVAGDASGKPLLMKISDLGGSIQLDWAKTPDNAGVALAANSRFDVIQGGTLVYTDARNAGNYGFQQEDILLAYFDNNLTSCLTQDDTANAQIFTFEYETLLPVFNLDTIPLFTQDSSFSDWPLLQDFPCGNSSCPVACQVSTINISTGWDPLTGTFIPPGGNDPLWQLTQAPPNANWTTSIPSFTIIPNGGWDVPGNQYNDQGWISGQPNGDYSPNNCGVGTCNPCIPEVYQFERSFCVCDSGSVTFNFSFAADDYASIFLIDASNNITPLVSHSCTHNNPPTHHANFRTPTPFSTIQFLTPGQYRLAAQLWNTDGEWMGLNIRGTITGASLESDSCCNPNGKITGLKYLDKDCDGMRDDPNNPLSNQHDPGLAGWTIELCDQSGQVVSSQVTGPDGRYSFNNVPPGTYTVKEVNQPGYTQSQPASTSYSVTVTTLGIVGGLDFGNCANPDDSCCVNYELFCQKVMAGFSVVREECGIEIIPNELDSCQQITIDWGDGGPTGSSVGSSPIVHTYAHSGTYTICLTVSEYGDLPEPCFTKDTCWSVCVTCDSLCPKTSLKNVWEKTFQDSGWDIAADVTLDATGDVYIVGTFENTLSFGNISLNGNSEGDVFFAKLDPNGQVIQAFGFGGDRDDRGEVIKIAPNGDIVIGGRLNGDGANGTLIDFDVNGVVGGIPSQVTVSTYQNFVARYNANFQLIWFDIFEGDKIMDIGFYKNNDIVVVGSTYSGNPTLRQNLIKRYIPSGSAWTKDWDRIFGGNRYNDNTWTIETDPVGGIYVSGQFSENETLDGYPIGYPGFVTSGYVANLDENGNFQWAFDITDDNPSLPINNQGGGVAFDIEIDYPYLFVVGDYTALGLSNFNPNNTSSPVNLQDTKGGMYIAKYDISTDPTSSQNNPLWVFGVPTNSRNFYDIELDGMGNLLVTGHLDGPNINFDPNGPNSKATFNSTANEPDIFLVKYTDLYNGTVLPTFLSGILVGGSNPDLSYGMVVQNGDIYIAGARDHIPYYAFVEADAWLGKFQCVCPPEIGQVDCCDSLSVEASPFNGDQCCYDFNIYNNIGYDICKVEVELQNSDWIINTSKVQLANGFQLTSSSNKSLCIEHVSGVIPGGTTPGFLQLCLSNLISPASTPQQVVFKWYEKGKDGVKTVACTDTLELNCTAPVEEQDCIAITDISIQCNPENPLEYEMVFTVTNKSLFPFDAYQIVLQSQTPGVSFKNCTGGGINNPIYVNPIPLPLPASSTSNPICVKVVVNNPVLSPEAFCFTAGLEALDACCYSTELYCDTLQPCCMPCESVSVISEEQVIDFADCCYSLDLINDCQYNFFSKIEFELQTNGVIFGSHFLGDPINWDVLCATTTKVCLGYSNTFIPPGSYPDFFQFCLDDIDNANEVPQVIKVTYYTLASDGTDSLACEETLTYECAAPVDNSCLVISGVEISCDEAQGAYTVSFNVENVSNPVFTATALGILPLEPGISITPNPVPLPGLKPGDPPVPVTVTVNTVPFPDPDGLLPLAFRLKYAGGDSCCNESVLDTLSLPFCEMVFTEDKPLSDQNSVVIFPNPTSGNLNLKFVEPLNQRMRFEMYDLLGKMVFEQALEAGITIFRIYSGTLAEGVYLIKISNGEKDAIFKRVIIQR